MKLGCTRVARRHVVMLSRSALRQAKQTSYHHSTQGGLGFSTPCDGEKGGQETRERVLAAVALHYACASDTLEYSPFQSPCTIRCTRISPRILPSCVSRTALPSTASKRGSERRSGNHVPAKGLHDHRRTQALCIQRMSRVLGTISRTGRAQQRGDNNEVVTAQGIRAC